MDEIERKSFEIESFISEFQENFLRKFGVLPVVTIEGYSPIPKLSLIQIEEMCNKVLDYYKKSGDSFPNGLKTKSRKRELVVTRQCFYKIARDLHYTLYSIADYLGFDHATVIHGVRVVNQQIDLHDPLIVIIYSAIRNEISKTVRDEGDVQSDNKEESDSQPALSSL